MEPVRTKAEVIERLQAQYEQLRALGVARLGLFSSFARDEAGPESDVDLLAELEDKALTLNGYFAVIDFLEELLGRSVDVLTPSSWSRHIGPHILREVADVPLAA
ncbi:MAG: nucleotidyltransferase family protein [Hymenobacter sp.]